MRRRQFLAAAAGLLAAERGISTRANAGNWPERPVKMIVPWPPGGATDLLARPWAEALTQAFNRQFVIENRGGAGGMIGNEAAARAAPDGYTLLFTSRATMTVLPHLREVPYDPVKSFAPISPVGDYVCGFALHPEVGPRTFAEFIDLARRSPGRLTYGSAGSGTTTHLRIEVIRQKAGVDILHVPYRGGADALVDVLSGVTSSMNEPTTLPHVRNGKLVLLNVNHTERSPDFPEVPTLKELGYPDADMPLSFGLYAPAGVSSEIVGILNEKMRALLATPAMRVRLWALSAMAPLQTPEQMAAANLADSDINRRLIASAKIKLDG